MMDNESRAKLKAIIKRKLLDLDTEDAQGQAGQAIVELDQQSVGRLSRMDALQSQAMAKATQAQRTGLRHRLTQALRDIETCDYGYCADCGNDIAIKRLEFDPSIRLCLECAKG